jgi:serine/threonine-protein kinase RsbW
MEFPANLSSLEAIFHFIRESLSASHEVRKKIELAIEEIFMNIISYSESPCVEIKIDQEDGVAYITIKDWGIPFNPLTHTKKDQDHLPVEEMEVGGLGIFFLKKLVDDISYERINHMNILRIKKALFNIQEATG